MGNNMPSFGLRATGSKLRGSIDTRRRMSRVLQVFPRFHSLVVYASSMRLHLPEQEIDRCGKIRGEEISVLCKIILLGPVLLAV